jgi:integrase
LSSSSADWRRVWLCGDGGLLSVLSSSRPVGRHSRRRGRARDREHVSRPRCSSGLCRAFATPADVESVADELAAEYRLIPILAAWTGLRPEEWLALERGDIDRKAKAVTRPACLHGRQRQAVREAGGVAQSRSAPRSRPRGVGGGSISRIDTPRLFSRQRGGALDLHWMGTSVEQIDRTYGHLLPDSLERARNGARRIRGEVRRAR